MNFMGFTASSPWIWYLPRWERSLGSSALGNCSMRFCRALHRRLNESMWCCVNTPTRNAGLTCTVPIWGSSLPRMQLSSVDLPAPLGPSSPMRLRMSTPKCTSRNSGVRPYPKVTPCTAMTGEPTSPGSGNWKRKVVSSSSSSTASRSSLSMALMRDWTSAARLALKRNLSTKSCMCLRFSCCASSWRFWLRMSSARTTS
mmetsp:Transcript_15337/g.52020  ORF Transcript_15337/g.52020 Transcript_15337/m.52020 type:complete len:200 (-) Transcript_15337:1116-1715(-)